MSQKHNIMKKIKNLFYNIKNIFRWSKILWNNFDWDYTYLLEIIEYKLFCMKEYFENAKITTSETYAEMSEKIDIALDACHQLTSRDFESKLLDPHYEKYPFRADEWNDGQGRKVHGMLPMESKEKEDFLAMTKKIDDKEKEYKHQLFDTMRDYYDWWWD